MRSSVKLKDARGAGAFHCISLAFGASGTWRIPALAFHGVMIATGHAAVALGGRPHGERPLRLGGGATLILQPGVRGDYTWRAPHDLLIGCIDPNLVLEIGAAAGVAHEGRLSLPAAFEARDTVGEYLLRGIAEELQRPPHPAQQLVLQSLAKALACRILDGQVERVESVALQGGLSRHALRRVQAFLEEHLARRISLEELANVAGVSRFHFARQFRVSVGESPMRYLTRVRIERAKRLLREGTMSGADIASTVGFADQSHFTRTFQRLVGVSPRRFVRDDATTIELPRVMRPT